jgi:hypothetical protein
MFWGGWYGAVVGVLVNHDDTLDNGVLSDMLIGSDAAVAVTAVAARGARLSRNRMRLIHLCGVPGGVFGAGAAVPASDEIGEEAVIALIGGGTTAGLLLGVRATRGVDQGKDLASLQRMDPQSVAASLESGQTVRFGPVAPARPNPSMRAGPPRLGVRVTF